MRYVLTAVLSGALVAFAWLGTSTAQQLQLRAASPTCAAGFTASGNNNGYTCTSASFKCNARMTIFKIPGEISGNRYRYTCGFPQG